MPIVAPQRFINLGSVYYEKADLRSRGLELGDGRELSSHAVFYPAEPSEIAAFEERLKPHLTHRDMAFCISSHPSGLWVHGPAWMLEILVSKQPAV